MNTHSFDQGYWEKHWNSGPQDDHSTGIAANPYLVEELGRLSAGTALDAGCGTGGEAIWLAQQGWSVTGADISSSALAKAATRAHRAGIGAKLSWIETDLTSWSPQQRWDLVLSCYAHSALPQLEFYQRISDWTAPGGTLLIVGHRFDDHFPAAGHEDQGHPREATANLTNVTALFSAPEWQLITARENTRVITTPAGTETVLNDIVVRFQRQPSSSP